jgi:ankyrin repeat protein
MDEFANSEKNSSPSSPSPSPTKELCDTRLYETLKVRPSNSISYSKDLQEIISCQNYYLHYLVLHSQVALISQFLHLTPLNLDEILNFKDHHGNSPLFLAVKLCSSSRESLSIVRMLLENGADVSAKDSNGWTMIDEAVCQKNRELVSVLFEFLYIKRLLSWEKSRVTAQSFLSALPDFFVEIKWEFSSNVIPLVSKIGPHDICKLWKVGSKLRFDSTLVGWKNLRSKRRNISVIFDEELFIVNHSKQMVVNPLEELDHEETNEVINDIMSSEPVQGNLSLLGHNISEEKNWRGLHNSKIIGNWKAFKYRISFRTHVAVVKKSKKSESFQDYFKGVKGNMPKPSFTRKKTRKIPEVPPRTKSVGDQTVVNVKNNTLYCWVCYDFPLKLEELLSVLEVLKNANKSLDKLFDFLVNEGIATLLPENSFPIKFEIPVALGIRAKLTFLNFSLLDNESQLFEIPSYNRVSRRVGQKTLTSPKKRLLFTNLVA